MSTEIATHTPGPWYFNDEDTSEFGHYSPARIFSGADTNNPKFVAEIAVRTNYEANARLIAAAPELLEALEAIQGVLPGELGEAKRIANAAIRKAKEGK